MMTHSLGGQRTSGGSSTIAIMIETIGPYHAARMAAAGGLLGPGSVLALEMAARSREYAWAPVESVGFRRRTVVTDADYQDLGRRTLRAITWATLEEEQPEVVAVNGWGFAEARAALAWCRRRRRVAILMSESQGHDAPRAWIREHIKRELLSAVDAALVGGQSHANYLVELGLPRERIFLGYDAVDNDYFQKGANAARQSASALRAKLALPDRYLLASARFIEKKNLLRLLEAYAAYRSQVGAPAWGLVILGDGKERPVLEARRSALGLDAAVLLPGFKQYPDLPAYYGLSSAFILPSTAEQWGLVVNEAMASEVPVLVSRACGSAELVSDGVSGYRFDPLSVADISRSMVRMTMQHDRLAQMGKAAAAAVARASPGNFAQGLAVAIECGKAHLAHRSVHSRWNPALWW